MTQHLKAAFSWMITLSIVASPFASVAAFELLTPAPTFVQAARGFALTLALACAALIAVILRVKAAVIRA